jgi:hypothetical protein
MRRWRSLAGALALAILCQAASETEQSVNGLFTSIRAMVRAHRPDAEVARLVEEQHLSERLDDAVIEQLASEGAGPETIDALERQREVSHHLATAAPVKMLELPAAAPPEAERAEVLEKARASALRYLAGLPDFVCTQTVHRYMRGRHAAAWKMLDVLRWEVGYSGKQEQYKLISINGQAARNDAQARNGTTSNGEFGSILEMIFNPQSAAQFDWQRRATLRGRAAYVFSYAIDQPHSRYTLNELHALRKDRQITVAVRGFVYIDPETSETLRLTTEVTGIPPKFSITESRSAVDYGSAKIGGQVYFLPRRSDLAMVESGTLHRNVLEFGNYRKFATEATLTFEK